MKYFIRKSLCRLSVLLRFLAVILTTGRRHCRLVGSMWMTPLEHEAQMSFHIQLFTIPIPRNGFWWAQVESNHRPHAYQACALTFWAMSPCYLHNHRYRPIRRSVSLNLYGFGFSTDGGDEGIRTLDPLLAGQVLSQLSYTPIFEVRRKSE